MTSHPKIQMFRVDNSPTWSRCATLALGPEAPLIYFGSSFSSNLTSIRKQTKWEVAKTAVKRVHIHMFEEHVQWTAVCPSEHRHQFISQSSVFILHGVFTSRLRVHHQRRISAQTCKSTMTSHAPLNISMIMSWDRRLHEYTLCRRTFTCSVRMYEQIFGH